MGKYVSKIVVETKTEDTTGMIFFEAIGNASDPYYGSIALYSGVNLQAVMDHEYWCGDWSEGAVVVGYYPDGRSATICYVNNVTEYDETVEEEVPEVDHSPLWAAYSIPVVDGEGYKPLGMFRSEEDARNQENWRGYWINGALIIHYPDQSDRVKYVVVDEIHPPIEKVVEEMEEKMTLAKELAEEALKAVEDTEKKYKAILKKYE